MEGERQRLIIDSLSESLRLFAGTDFAQAAMSRTLPPDFSRARLLDDLAGFRVRFPPSPLRERMLGEPDFLAKVTSESRIREWEISRHVLVAVLQALESRGIDFARDAALLRYSFAHTGSAALAMAAVFPTAGGFGVDLEPVGREISDAAFARFHRAPELEFLTDRLDHWVLKEAAYKAHPRSSETIVADYEITSRVSDSGEFALVCRKGEPVVFRAIIGSTEGFRFAFAETSARAN